MAQIQSLLALLLGTSRAPPSGKPPERLFNRTEIEQLMGCVRVVPEVLSRLEAIEEQIAAIAESLERIQDRIPNWMRRDSGRGA